MLLQKVEGRVASDQELKLTELLRYYMRDIQAAKVRHRNPFSFAWYPLKSPQEDLGTFSAGTQGSVNVTAEQAATGRLVSVVPRHFSAM